MCDLYRLIFGLVVDLIRSRTALEAEALVLKQQIIVLRRGKPNRMPFLAVDKFILGWFAACFRRPNYFGGIGTLDRELDDVECDQIEA
jgi:hypothetical protein